MNDSMRARLRARVFARALVAIGAHLFSSKRSTDDETHDTRAHRASSVVFE